MVAAVIPDSPVHERRRWYATTLACVAWHCSSGHADRAWRRGPTQTRGATGYRLRHLHRSNISRSGRDPWHRHTIRVSLCPARCPGETAAGEQYGTLPGRILDGEPRRTGVYVYAAVGAEVP